MTILSILGREGDKNSEVKMLETPKNEYVEEAIYMKFIEVHRDTGNFQGLKWVPISYVGIILL